MDHCSWELLFGLSRHTPAGNMLVLLTIRPRDQVLVTSAYDTLTKQFPNLEHMLLGPLDREGIQEIVDLHSGQFLGIAEPVGLRVDSRGGARKLRRISSAMKSLQLILTVCCGAIIAAAQSSHAPHH